MSELKLDIITNDEWYLLRGEEKIGPFSYTKILEMQQNKEVFDFDYVWASHMDSWHRIGELAEFSIDRISRITEKNQDSKVFYKRKYVRIPLTTEVLAHDNQILWPGRTVVISEGGACVFMENPFLLPGDQIQLHMKKINPDDSAFNAKAEVLNKKLTKQRIQHNTGIQYTVRFLQIESSGLTQLKNWIEKKEKTNGNTQVY